MNAVQKLRQMVGEIRAPKGPMQLISSWELVRGLLGRMPTDQSTVKRVCDAKDLAGYETIVAELEALDAQQRGGSGGNKPGSNPAGTAASATPAAAAPISPELAHQMDAAMKAFRKRLKVTRLADESTLAGRRLTSGKKSQVDAILPPHEFPDEVWKALANAGKITHTGQGFYALVGDSGGSASRDEILT